MFVLKKQLKKIKSFSFHALNWPEENSFLFSWFISCIKIFFSSVFLSNDFSFLSENFFFVFTSKVYIFLKLHSYFFQFLNFSFSLCFSHKKERKSALLNGDSSSSHRYQLKFFSSFAFTMLIDMYIFYKKIS